jgi:hypothetical protein
MDVDAILRRHPLLLKILMRWWALQRPFWRVAWIARNWDTWRYDRQKWAKRPKIGDRVRDCRGEIHTVVSFRGHPDQLTLEDGHGCSWMNCCDPVDTKK